MKKRILVLASAISFGASAQELEEVIVKSHPLAEDGLSQTVETLDSDELLENAAASLGETVANLPGVRSASFGAASSRPVIHGLGGPRVKTTQDQIDSLDVSVTSTDHAVTVEPFIADQITVLKGASTLLYGTGAIGGVVDTVTGRIPTELPERDVEGRAEYRFSDNGDAETGAFRLDGRLGDNMAWHLDAFSKEADDYEIPVGAESRAQLAAEGEEFEPGASTLEGSFYDLSGGAIGFSFIGDQGFIGASVSTTDSVYGLVGGHAHEEEHGHEDEHDEDHDEHDEDHEEDHDEHDEDHDEHEDEHEHDEEEEAPGRIDLEQTRFDLEAQLNLDSALWKHINFRVGVNDYEHAEIEGNGEIGTLFDNDAWEARLSLVHQAIAGFEGTLGIQIDDRDFSALGEEAFVPPVQTESMGVFWVAEQDLDNLNIELGARFERTEHVSTESGVGKLSFDNASASIGGVYSLNDAHRLSALIDYTQRAPSAEELFSNGPHLATQTFDIGDVNLDQESGLGFTFTWSFDSDLVDARISVYHTEFDDFIYQSNTGEIDDDLPVFVYRQNDASFTGFDAEASFHLARFAEGDLDLELMVDQVSTDLSAPGELPRIPADRARVGLKWENADWSTKLTYTRQSAQNTVAALELPTPAYDDISLRLKRSWETNVGKVNFFIHGRNLGDDEQREHVSFVKDFAPAPGRRIEAGLQIEF